MTHSLSVASAYIIPIFIMGAVVYGFFKKVPVYDSFINGAKDGFSVILNIFPYLLAIFVAVKSFQASGAFDLIGRFGGTTLTAWGVPPELITLFLIKPLSGSASLAIFSDIVKNTGPESLASLIGAVIVGSAETTFYVLAVYLGAVNIKKTRYLVPVCLTADIVGMIIAIIVVRLLYS
ncbi:MAG: spore maturation protein [Deltaproteobacteria bacterium]|nr:spore maturation protein [Deltaproteobacteria bacterium]